MGDNRLLTVLDVEQARAEGHAAGAEAVLSWLATHQPEAETWTAFVARARESVTRPPPAAHGGGCCCVSCRTPHIPGYAKGPPPAAETWPTHCIHGGPVTDPCEKCQAHNLARAAPPDTGTGARPCRCGHPPNIHMFQRAINESKTNCTWGCECTEYRP